MCVFKMNDVLCVILCVVELATHDQFCKKRAITFLGSNHHEKFSSKQSKFRWFMVYNMNVRVGCNAFECFLYQ